MKDAKGHGSDRRGKYVDINGRGIIPSRPFREGTAHQVSLAEKHGIPTDHLVNVQPVRDFGKRNTVPAGGPGNPNVPAHQSRIGALVREFAKSEAGAGRVPDFANSLTSRGKDASDVSDLVHTLYKGLAHHGEPSSILDFMRFLGFLGAIAIIDVLALGMGLK